MTSHDMNSELLRRYLLGELDAGEADILEERLLREDELFELAEAVEGDLLAACARGELSPAERGRVLRRLAASPRGQARLALARDLNTLAGQQEAPRGTLLPFRYPRLFSQPAGRAAVLAASLLVVVGGLWLGRQTGHPGEGTIVQAPGRTIAPSRPVPPIKQGRQDRRATQTEDEPVAPVAEDPAPAPPAAPPAPAYRIAERPPQPSAPTAPFVIQIASLMRTRSAGGPLVAQEIPAETRLVEIRLPLEEWVPEEHASFSAVVKDADQEVWRTEDAEVTRIEESPYVILSIPASELQEGKYWIELRGLTPEGDSDLIGELQIEIRRQT